MIDGIDIIDHAQSGDCPEKRFDEPPIQTAPAVPLAGDIVAAMTKKLGADRAAKTLARLVGKADCGCAKRQQRLNDLDRRLRKVLNLTGRKWYRLPVRTYLKIMIVLFFGLFVFCAVGNHMIAKWDEDSERLSHPDPGYYRLRALDLAKHGH